MKVTDKLYKYDGTSVDIYASNQNRLIRDTDLVYTTRRGSYRVQSACYDSARNIFYAIGDSLSDDGTGRLFSFADWRHPDVELAYAVLETGHSNSITYNPITDEILVTCGGTTYPNDLAVIDPTDFTITRRITYETGNEPTGVAFCGDCVAILILATGAPLYMELRSFDLDTVLMTKEVPKPEVSDYFGYPDEGCITGQSLTYDPETEMIYRVYTGHNTAYTPTGTEYLAEWDYGFLAGYSKDDLTFKHAIAMPVTDKEEVESYIFGGDCDYILCDGNYICYREYHKKLPARTARTAIPSNADINTYFNIGEYFSNSKAITQTLSNIPTINSGFTMYVFQAGNDLRCQIIFVINGNIFVRFGQTTSDWTAWKKVSMTNA